MHTRAVALRSPAVMSMSISRPGRVLETWRARRSSSSVSLPIALTTSTTWSPRCRVRATWSATSRMRSGSATDVPPNFWTSRATGAGYPATCGPGPSDSAVVPGAPVSEAGRCRSSRGTSLVVAGRCAVDQAGCHVGQTDQHAPGAQDRDALVDRLGTHRARTGREDRRARSERTRPLKSPRATTIELTKRMIGWSPAAARSASRSSTMLRDVMAVASATGSPSSTAMGTW